MSKIYADYDDKYVKNTIIYIGPGKNNVETMIAYKDKTCTDMFSKEELLDAYVKGAIVSPVMPDDSDVIYYTIIGCTSGEFTTSITIIVDGQEGEVSSKEADDVM